MKVAFIIHRFPQTSEVFIINQVADLIDRGIDVQIFSYERGDAATVSERYDLYRMWERTHIIGVPNDRWIRMCGGISHAIRLLIKNPRLLKRALNVRRYGSRARSLQMLYAAAAFSEQTFDVVHCHFGKIANQYLPIRRMMAHAMPMITSFYGYDVSHLPKIKGAAYYEELKRVCHRYIVMSEDMKRRVAALGFNRDELVVVPVSIQVDEFPFVERTLDSSGRVEIVSVGRFVEKKGFDDLIRALAIVKASASRPFHCTIIGGGELESKIQLMTVDLKLGDIVSFAGYMKLKDVLQVFLKSHLYVQPSKTAANGDME